MTTETVALKALQDKVLDFIIRDETWNRVFNESVERWFTFGAYLGQEKTKEDCAGMKADNNN